MWWDWVAIGCCAFMAMFTSGLAVFWGGEVGAVGYWYWGVIAAICWGVTAFLIVAQP